MPDITRAGVTLTAELQEAAAIAPLGRALLYAYELWHPSLSEPVRFVDDKEDLSAALESDAPRDPSTLVLFIACPLQMARPEESDTAANPTVSLSRPDVSGLLKAAFDLARGDVSSWELIERVYASDDTSGPAMLPVRTLEVSSVDISGSAGKLEASFDDDANESIPAITFRRAHYPGLQR